MKIPTKDHYEATLTLHISFIAQNDNMWNKRTEKNVLKSKREIMFNNYSIHINAYARLLK